MKFLRMATKQTTTILMLCLTTIATIGESAILAPSSQALTATMNFTCGKSDGVPATVARTRKGDIPIVMWSSEGFSESGFTPQVRCQQVSARFQMLYRSGQLKYITAGTLNNLPVLCATKQLSGTCDRQNLLYTLKPNSDPQLTIKKLMLVRNRATSKGIEESAPTATVSSNSIDLNWLEEERGVEDRNSNKGF